jgi:putative ABC transport system permease protein
LSVNASFVLRFVLAELRHSWFRFLFVVIAFAVGVGVLVAVTGLSANVRESIDSEAKSLLAADVTISSSSPLLPEVLDLAPGKKRVASEVTFASMLAVPNEGGSSRLVQVRALEGEYPFYGEALVEPPAALSAVTMGNTRGALLDRVLAQQFNLGVGSEVGLGKLRFAVVGIIHQLPGESYARTLIAPKIIVPLGSIAGSELLQRGSRITHKEHFAFSSEEDVSKFTAALRGVQKEHRFEIETVASRRNTIARTLDTVSRFLALLSFSALLLGGVGVASAMHHYIQTQLPVIASLRCIGANTKDVMRMYLMQSVIVSVMGASLGGAVGIGVQYLLPSLFGDFLPLRVSAHSSVPALLQGMLVGVLVSLLFCLRPLLRVVAISPLQAIRGLDSEPTTSRTSNRGVGFLALGGATLLLASTTIVMGNLRYGFFFALGLLAVVGLLWGLSVGISKALQGMRPRFGGFALRYGLASIHRPQNQTGALILTLGLSAFLLSIVYLAQSMVLSQVEFAGSGDRPNLILFDVQSDQRDGVRSLLREKGLELHQEVPIVTMRLLEINGRDNLELRSDKEIPEWTLRREYRSSYRDHLIESEKLVSGSLVPRFSGDLTQEEVPVTVEEGIARDLKLALGDRVLFDVQGVSVRARIIGIRQVDWRRVQTNFFFLFPAGVLEDAPQFFALIARAPSSESVASLQRILVRDYGNVSAIDLNLILETADEILNKVASAVQFLALFTIAAGLFVLAGSIATSRASRLREILLLKTVGATHLQLFSSGVVEFLLLGLAAACVGVLSGIAAASFLSFYYFETVLRVSFLPLVAIASGIVAVVVTMGVASTVGMLRVSPMQVLRTSP